MEITFELNGETKRIKYDGNCYMPLLVTTGGKNLKTGEISTSINERADGYYSKLSGAVKRIIDNSFVDADEVLTLQEYVDRYETAIQSIKDQIDIDI